MKRLSIRGFEALAVETLRGLQGENRALEARLAAQDAELELLRERLERMEAAQTGTRVKNRACRPHYANVATSRAGQDLARRMSACDPRSPDYGACLEGAMAAGTSEAQAQLAIIPYMDKRLDDEFRRLATEQPELATAILEYLAKEREYSEAVRSREDSRASSRNLQP